MNKKGVSTLIEVAALLLVAILFLTAITKARPTEPSVQNGQEIIHNEDWQTNNAG